jgi:hypothetical protein
MGNKSIGTPGAPFGNVFAISSNSATMNTSTIQARTVFLTGNVVASNAYQGSNLFTTQMNVTGVSNTFSLGATNVGIGMSIPLVAVTGTAYIDSTIAATQGFGGYVALSSDGIVMVSTNSPYVMVYQYNGSSWTGPFNTLMSTATTNVSCPIAVSSDGTVVIVGDYSNGSRGYAAVFRTGSESVLTNPTADYSSFGWTVALSADGNTALVSAPNDADDDGWVGIYKYSGGAWGSATALVSTFGQYGAFGTTAGLSGDGLTVIVTNGYNTTAIYRYSGGVWSYASQLPVSIASFISTQRGISISYDGNTIVAGFPFYSGSTGIVGVYKYSGGSWVETLITNSVEPYINFGASVSISTNGNILVVGAPAASYPNNKGWAGVYTYSGGSWGSPSQLIYTPSNNDNFGWTVAVSSTGSTVIVGSRAAYVGAFIKGPYTSYLNLSLGVQGNVYMSNVTTTNVSLYNLLNVSGVMNTGCLVTTGIVNPVYQLPAINPTTLTNPAGGTPNWGSNVYYSGDGSTMVTFSTITGGGYSLGFVYKFTSNIFGEYWNTYNFNSIFYLNASSQFGYTAALSNDGNTLIVGDPGVNWAGVYTYVNGVWSNPPTNLIPGSFGPGQSFGSSVAISPAGDIAVVGNPGINFGTGAVYVYTYSAGIWSSAISIPYYTLNTYFGYSVAISGYGAGLVGTGYTIIIGAPGGPPANPGVFLYGFDGSNFVGPGALAPPGIVASDYLGYSVAISSDGLTAVAGAPYYASGAGCVVGVGPGGPFTLVSGAGFNFGTSVALSADGLTAVVGAPNASSGTGYAAKYTYSAGTWNLYSLVYAPAISQFGKSVAISSCGIFIGSLSQSIIFYSSLGYPTGGANLNITGDAWVSNVILTQNVYATTINAATLKTTTLSTVGIIDVGEGVSASTFEVQGNVYASNALVTQNLFANIYSTRANVRTMNATTVTVTGSANMSPTLNVNTINVNSISITILNTTNIYTSNSLSSTNLSVTNTIYYNEDLTKRSLYLQPSSTNAPAIQSAISATCNASTKSYWCTSPKPVYGNVISVSSTSNAYSGGVYLPDGRVVFVTSNCTNIGIFNPSTSAFTSVTGAPPGYNGGVLMPNGNVFFAPQTSNIGLFNPVTSKFSNNGQLYGQSYNGVLAPDGVWLTPSKYSSSFGASQIALYNNQFSYAIPTEQLPNPVSVTAGSFIARGVSVAWSSGIGKFVSIENAGSSYYSSDGKTWTLSTGTTLASIDPTCVWFAVAASSTRFVATGGNGNYNSAYSTDGINWNAPSAFQNLRTINSTMTWQALAYNSIYGYFVAMGSGGSIFAGTNYALTPDGITWYAQTSTGSPIPYTSLTTDYFGNQLAVTSGGGPTGGAWYFSGGSWTQFPPPGGPLTTLQDLGSVWNSVAYSSSLSIFVAVGSTNGGSSSGSAWAPAPPGAQSWSAASPSLASVEVVSEWTSVSWSAEASMFIAVGYNSGTSAGVGAYSRDGKSWYTMNPPISSLFGSKYITWSSSLGLWAIISGSGGIAPGSGYAYLAADGYNTGSVLLPSGAIMFSPIGSANVMSFQQTFTYLVSNIVVGTDVFNGMVLAPNGNVITVPSGSNIYVINPTTGTSTNVGPIAGSVTNLFRGGALLPSGNVVFAPGTSANVGMFDPVALTYSNSVAAGTSGIAFSGATLLPNGQVVFTPYDSANVGVVDTFAPVSQEFCLSPYFNKF